MFITTRHSLLQIILCLAPYREEVDIRRTCLRAETAGNGLYPLRWNHPATTQHISFPILRFVPREPSSTLQEHRKTCQSVQIDVLTTWGTTDSVVLKSEHWKTNPEIQKFPTLDILLAFEEQMRRAQVEKSRKGRKVRGVQGMRGLDFAFHNSYSRRCTTSGSLARTC